jgi:hypothetical protein
MTQPEPKPTAPSAVRALLRRLSRADRERLAERVDELDDLNALVKERPYRGRWSA